MLDLQLYCKSLSSSEAALQQHELLRQLFGFETTLAELQLGQQQELWMKVRGRCS
jgi:hypothetical protein